jgi:hypothetical protein
VLARLLELNTRRAQEEALAGLRAEKKQTRGAPAQEGMLF